MYGHSPKIAAIFAVFTMLTFSSRSAQAADDIKPICPTRLMCLGDSITDGFWLSGGYRNTLCEELTTHGEEKLVDFVGPNWGGCGYDPQHAGYSGYSIENIAQEQSISGQRTGIASFIDNLLTQYPADVIFLQIGTNDILSFYDLDHFGKRLEPLVDTILDAIPAGGMLYLATLPCMDANDTLYIDPAYFTPDSMDEAIEYCNAQIRAIAAQKQQQGKPIRLAEVNRVLEKSELYDGVHPNETGYEKLGLFWYDVLQSYWHGEELSAPVLCGDINGDGTVSVADAVLLMRHLHTQSPLTVEQASVADLDGDRNLTAKDLVLLKRKMAQS